MPLPTQVTRQSLSTRLVIIFVAIIVTTAIAAGIPAYWIIRDRLEKEAWARVSDGGQLTLALLDTEEECLVNIATLAAQRPTLERLLQEGEEDALDAYLQIFQVGVEIDVLIAYDASGQHLAAALTPVSWLDLPLLQETTFVASSSANPQLALLTNQSIHDRQSGKKV